MPPLLLLLGSGFSAEDLVVKPGEEGDSEMPVERDALPSSPLNFCEAS